MSLCREVDPEKNAERALDDVVDAVLEDGNQLKQMLWERFNHHDSEIMAADLIEFIGNAHYAEFTLEDALRAELKAHLMDSDAHIQRINELNEADAEDADYLRDRARDDRLCP